MAAIPPIASAFSAAMLSSGISVEENAIDQLVIEMQSLRAATQDSPFRVVELALEIQVERMRVVEVLKARDAAVGRLADAYTLVRQYSEFIEHLQRERVARGLEKLDPASVDSSLKDLAPLPPLDSQAHIAALEATIKDLREINKYLKEYDVSEAKSMCDPPPNYEENAIKVSSGVQTDGDRDASNAAVLEEALEAVMAAHQREEVPAEDIPQLIKMRYELLAVIPLPENPPELTLAPIVLPAQITLHDFINGAPVTLRNALGNYRTLQYGTATWCPEREEHGFMYVPMFKCNTNPRTITAHRWNAVDAIGRMARPTECFYNNEGTWYYAGTYKAFMMGTASVAEWESLSAETKAAIVKETLAARKNTTPQTNYETGQLYAAGALKLAVVGLQCIGFSQEIYHSVTSLSTELLQATASAAAAAAAAAAMKPNSSPTTSTPGSMPKPKLNSSPLFNAFMANKQKLTLSTSSLNHGGSFFGSPTSTSGTPPLSGGPSDISACSSAIDYSHRLLPHCYPASKLNSPLSNPGSGGPSTPNFTPGLASSPGQGTSPNSTTSKQLHVQGGTTGGIAIHPPHSGLGTGSGIWNSAMGSHFSGFVNPLTARPPLSMAKNNENNDGLGLGRLK
ncbi:hypothetical protein BKA70DRAFT_1394622 [Coprinopsis sp. MPI-PUGE-AT-0042]|nr:hypothetical protein BKA70DRAFT_1394622 [Coprinopsis sp. MPI-PUGE-AT-0042]